MKKINISKLKLNTENPRFIKDEKFESLVKSIKDFPEMLELRPVVVNKAMVVLGGNYRLKACEVAGVTEIPCIIATNLSKEQEKEFIIKDNVGFGEWDWEVLRESWSEDELESWGLDIWEDMEEVDYSILDDSLDDDISDMADGVKKAIQIEFDTEHYEEAQELVKYWRQKGAYVGAMLIEKLKESKESKDET